MTDFVALQEESWGCAEAHGWHDLAMSFGDRIALIHSEVSECLEEYREGKGIQEVYYSNGKPEGIPTELADIVIRVMDMAEEYGIDLIAALIEKQAFNRSRPFLHGGKKI